MLVVSMAFCLLVQDAKDRQVRHVTDQLIKNLIMAEPQIGNGFILQDPELKYTVDKKQFRGALGHAMAGTHGSRERTQTRREDRKKMRRGWGRAVANRALQELRRRKVARSPFHFWNRSRILPAREIDCSPRSPVKHARGPYVNSRVDLAG